MAAAIQSARGAQLQVAGGAGLADSRTSTISAFVTGIGVFSQVWYMVGTAAAPPSVAADLEGGGIGPNAPGDATQNTLVNKGPGDNTWQFVDTYAAGSLSGAGAVVGHIAYLMVFEKSALPLGSTPAVAVAALGALQA